MNRADASSFFLLKPFILYLGGTMAFTPESGNKYEKVDLQIPCPNCGLKLSGKAVMCPKCGTRFGSQLRSGGDVSWRVASEKSSGRGKSAVGFAIVLSIVGSAMLFLNLASDIGIDGLARLDLESYFRLLSPLAACIISMIFFRSTKGLLPIIFGIGAILYNSGYYTSIFSELANLDIQLVKRLYGFYAHRILTFLALILVVTGGFRQLTGPKPDEKPGH